MFTRMVTKIFLLLALGGSVISSVAYTYVQVGVDSNFLIESNHVSFAQSDGSLTTLSVEDGTVLTRNKTRDFSGTFKKLPDGILQFGFKGIAMLDPIDFKVRWETSLRDDPNVTPDALISRDDEGHVECRNLRDGHVRWSYDLSAISTMVVESGRVLLHRDATYDPTKFPMIVLLDEATGKLLLRRIATNQLHWARTWFDGTNIFIEGNTYRSNRFDYRTDRIWIWDTAGEEKGMLNIPILQQQAVRDGQIFDLDYKTFWRGRVYSNRDAIPLERRDKPESVMGPTNGFSRTFETAHPLSADDVLVERATYTTSPTNSVAAFSMQVELRDATNRWTGVLSYLMNRGRIAAVAEANGRILIGTDMGHVECVDRDTGETHWLYYFPTLRRAINVGAHEPMPTQTEAAEMFRSDNSQIPTWGLQVVGSKAVQPRIIADPKPLDPYRKLSLNLTLAWCGGSIPLAILIILFAVPGSRKWEPSSLGSMAVWLTFASFSAYAFFHGVSYWSNLTLKAALVAGYCAGIYCVVQCCRRKQWIEAAIISVVFFAVALFMVQALVG